MFGQPLALAVGRGRVQGVRPPAIFFRHLDHVGGLPAIDAPELVNRNFFAPHCRAKSSVRRVPGHDRIDHRQRGLGVQEALAAVAAWITCEKCPRETRRRPRLPPGSQGPAVPLSAAFFAGMPPDRAKKQGPRAEVQLLVGHRNSRSATSRRSPFPGHEQPLAAQFLPVVSRVGEHVVEIFGKAKKSFGHCESN